MAVNFSTEELVRYSRQIMLEEIGRTGQEKLSKARVAIVGAGGLGCPAITYLLNAGVGFIRVIDADVVSLSNLPRQTLYSSHEVGQKKVTVVQQRAQALNGNVVLEGVDERLTQENATRLFADVDVVVDGSDNFETRYVVDKACWDLRKPLVAGSIFQFEGQLSVFHYQKAPGLRALYPHPPQADERPACSTIGVLGIVPGIVGTLQANEVLKILLNLGEVLAGKLLVLDALKLQFHTIDYSGLEADYGETVQGVACSVAKPVGKLVHYAMLTENSNYYFVDVRSIEEHERHNLGGVCIPLPELSDNLDGIPNDQDVLLYCKSGMRSNQAALELSKLRNPDRIFQLHGGIEAVPASAWRLS